MSHVVCVLKTNEGGRWAVPQAIRMRMRGLHVTFVIPPGSGRLRGLLDVEGFTVIESQFDFEFSASLRCVRGLLRLRRQIKALAPSVVFYHLYASALAARVATLGMRVRRIHMVAGPLYLDSTLIRSVERVLCRMDDVVIGGSRHTAQRYRELGMPEQRVRAIPYGVDTAAFSRELVDCSESPGTFRVIMVAYTYAPKSRVHPGVGIKGHEVLLAAWSKFREAHADAQLVLVGGGFDEAGEQHRQRLISTWAPTLGSSVEWVESVSDVRPWYAKAHLSVSPSLSENHGAALEASAMALPSIVSDAGALPEAVIPGMTGWIVPAGEVEPMVQALTCARSAWESGGLAMMGRDARALMVGEFEQADCADRVAQVVVGG